MFRGNYMKATGDIAGYWEVFKEIARRINRSDIVELTHEKIKSLPL